MSEEDRSYWDQRWTEVGPAPEAERAPDPPHFADLIDSFPTRGDALDVACGRGRGTAWLAQRGLTVTAIDVSPVAIELARQYATEIGMADRCSFATVDLDHGIPLRATFDLVFAYLYWQPHLTRQLVELVVPRGLVAVCHVSEIDVGPGEWQIAAGELKSAFGAVEGLRSSTPTKPTASPASWVLVCPADWPDSAR